MSGESISDPQRPSRNRILFALTLFVGLSVWFSYAWMLFADAYVDLGGYADHVLVEWLIRTLSVLFCTLAAARFVSVVFTSRITVWRVISAAVSAVVMLQTPHIIWDAEFFGAQVPYWLWLAANFNFDVFPRGGRMASGVIVVFVFGTLGLRELWGLPLYRLIPKSKREAMGGLLSRLTQRGIHSLSEISWIRPEERTPEQSRWFSLAGSMQLIVVQQVRALFFLYLIPFGFSALVLFLGFYVPSVLTYVRRDLNSRGYYVFEKGAVVMFCFACTLVLIYKYAGLLLAIVWLAFFAALCTEVSPLVLTSGLVMGPLYFVSIILSTIAIGFSVAETTKRDWGPRNDPLFFGSALPLPGAHKTYMLMARRMSRPYGVLLLLFVVAASFSFRSACWVAATWPIAAFVGSKLFRTLSFHEVMPFRFGQRDAESSNVDEVAVA